MPQRLYLKTEKKMWRCFPEDIRHLIHSLHLDKPLLLVHQRAGSGEKCNLFKCIKHHTTAGSITASYNSCWSSKNLNIGFSETWAWLEKSQIFDNSLLNILNNSCFPSSSVPEKYHPPVKDHDQATVMLMCINIKGQLLWTAAYEEIL